MNQQWTTWTAAFAAALCLVFFLSPVVAEEQPVPDIPPPEEGPERVVMARVGSAEIAVSDFVRFISLNPERVRAATRTEGKADTLRLMIENMLLQNAMATEGLLPANPTQEDYEAGFRVLAKKHFPAPEITDEQLRDYYAAHREDFGIPASKRLSHILIRLPKDADDAAKAAALERAEEALARLRRGEPFPGVAKEVSEAPDAEKGGDLGFIDVYTWSPWLRGALDGVAVEQHTEVVSSPAGYEILFVADEREALVPPFEEVREQVLRRLQAEQQDERRREYVKKLAQQIPIVIELEELKPEFANGVFP